MRVCSMRYRYARIELVLDACCEQMQGIRFPYGCKVQIVVVFVSVFAILWHENEFDFVWMSVHKPMSRFNVFREGVEDL